MNERRDDTTKPAGESRPPRERGDYYDDDATGYEVYRPEEEDEAGEVLKDETLTGDEE